MFTIEYRKHIKFLKKYNLDFNVSILAQKHFALVMEAVSITRALSIVLLKEKNAIVARRDLQFQVISGDAD